MQRKLSFVVFFLIIAVFVVTGAGIGVAKEPKGAKAIFDSGEGPSVGATVSQTPKATRPAEPVQREKYVGISYQLVLLSDDGQFKMVPKSRVFKSGERVKMLVRTNRPGYMTIMNIGPTGNTNVLYNEYIEAYTLQEVPKNTNFRFVGAPGTEKVLIMLSNEPNPIVQQPPVSAGSPPSAPPPSAPTATSDYYSTPPPSTQSMVASIDGAKGSKDIVAEDKMQNSFTVISPKNNWKPAKSGMKDIVLEQSAGVNYGVVPVAAMADGGILTLEIKLKHK
ncbi:MAG TPA: DUF4384 domain-containing protein [Dissulfurispiraceae bacterium]|nr:DUF4384 domain-containing protein [Dissulfurispiraceae bacterium]